jgi:hypothetical protein
MTPSCFVGHRSTWPTCLGWGRTGCDCGGALRDCCSHRHLLTMMIGPGMTGLGMGLETGPLMDSAISAVPHERSGTAASLTNVARMVGATVGVALLCTVYEVFRRGPVWTVGCTHRRRIASARRNRQLQASQPRPEARRQLKWERVHMNQMIYPCRWPTHGQPASDKPLF